MNKYVCTQLPVLGTSIVVHERPQLRIGITHSRVLQGRLGFEGDSLINWRFVLIRILLLILDLVFKR
jgi:hypothetical protein